MRLLGLGAGLLPLLLLGCGDAGHDRGRNVYFSSEDGVSGEGLAQDQADWPVAEPYPEDLVRPSPPPAPEPMAAPEVPARVVLWDDALFMAYGQAYVHDGERFLGDLGAMFSGQQNGLLGAAAPRNLALITSTHTGRVPVRVELLPAVPARDRVVAQLSDHAAYWHGGWD